MDSDLNLRICPVPLTANLCYSGDNVMGFVAKNDLGKSLVMAKIDWEALG